MTQLQIKEIRKNSPDKAEDHIQEGEETGTKTGTETGREDRGETYQPQSC